MKNFSQYNDDRGFTLVEMMITLFISMIIMSAVFVAYQAQQKSMVTQRSVAAMQQNLRSVGLIMERDIREAGMDPLTPPAGAGVVQASINSFGFTRDVGGDLINPNLADGQLDDPNESVAFSLTNDSDGDGIADLAGNPWGQSGSVIRTSNGVAQTIAQDIDALEFTYILDDGTQVQNPTPAQLNQIRGVQVAMLARAERVDPQFSSTLTYNKPIGQWQPINDGFRRRLSVITVFCRNLEL